MSDWASVIDYIRSAQARLATSEHAASEMLLTGPGNANDNQSTAMHMLVQGQRAAGHDLVAALDRAQELRHTSPYEDATDIIAGTGMLCIESGQNGRYAVGELSREGDPLPWKVVERREGHAPCVIDGYVTREAAEAVRDEMNGAAALWAASSEVQPIAGPTDAEEARCPRCEGCGKVANTPDQEPWTAWENLPLKSSHAVLMGIVKPIPCPVCGIAAAAEEAALARADRERESQASEEGEA